MKRIQCSSCKFGRIKTTCYRGVGFIYYSKYWRNCDAYKSKNVTLKKASKPPTSYAPTKKEVIPENLDDYRDWIEEEVWLPGQNLVGIRFRKNTPLNVKIMVGKVITR